MAITKEERQIVQRIKDARRIQITYDALGHLEFNSSSHDTRKLFHDLGIAIQDFFVKQSNKY